MATFCIPKHLVDKLKSSALRGEVDIAKLYDMSSSERRDFFAKYTDKELGKFINTEFEKAIISNQQDALTSWAESVFSPKEKTKPEPAPGDFSVQVGVFSSKENATNLATELLKKGFGAYAEDTEIEGKASYRVRVGKSSTQQEAVELEKQLQQQGYPTKICQ